MPLRARFTLLGQIGFVMISRGAGGKLPEDRLSFLWIALPQETLPPEIHGNAAATYALRRRS